MTLPPAQSRPSPDCPVDQPQPAHTRFSQPLPLIRTPGGNEGLIQAWVLHLAAISLLFPREHGQGHPGLVGPIPIGQHILWLDVLGIQGLLVLQPPHGDVLGVEVQSPTPKSGQCRGHMMSYLHQRRCWTGRREDLERDSSYPCQEDQNFHFLSLPLSHPFFTTFTSLSLQVEGVTLRRQSRL